MAPKQSTLHFGPIARLPDNRRSGSAIVVHSEDLNAAPVDDEAILTSDKLEEERDELAGAVNLDEPSSEEDMNIDI